jgi:hypothetical protein
MGLGGLRYLNFLVIVWSTLVFLSTSVAEYGLYARMSSLEIFISQINWLVL